MSLMIAVGSLIAWASTLWVSRRWPTWAVILALLAVDTAYWYAVVLELRSERAACLLLPIEPKAEPAQKPGEPSWR